MARPVLNLAYLVQMKRRPLNVKFFINKFSTFGMGWLAVQGRLVVNKSTNVQSVIRLF